MHASLTFAPPPVNDMDEFIQTYYDHCRQRVPGIEGIAGKWLFEDLIPGFSDFDTRFLVRDGFTASDWTHMAMQVAGVHYDLARERKEWARTLEHLPGVNLTWQEIFDPKAYYSEFSQWSFYDGDADKLNALRRQLNAHRWDASDEVYHWKKIAIYYGPYNRTIDPPINLGIYVDRYPLHSRLLHYFAPAVHAGVCLMQRQTTPGKLDAFRRARDLFPHPETIDEVLETIADYYRKPDLLVEPGLTILDGQLEDYLTAMVNVLRLQSGAPNCPHDASVSQLKAAVSQMSSGGGLSLLFENIKFARLMQGRLWFYSQEVAWFDSLPLIRIELSRIRRNFLEVPVGIYVRHIHGKELELESNLNLLSGEVFDDAQLQACKRFAILSDPDCLDSGLKQRAREIADEFDPFLHALEQLLCCAKQYSK